MTTFAMIMGNDAHSPRDWPKARKRGLPWPLPPSEGLITSLLLTLVVIPVAYDLFDEMKEKYFPGKDGRK
jgi:multidrug efflux pump subunit AcrB